MTNFGEIIKTINCTRKFYEEIDAATAQMLGISPISRKEVKP